MEHVGKGMTHGPGQQGRATKWAWASSMLGPPLPASMPSMALPLLGAAAAALPGPASMSMPLPAALLGVSSGGGSSGIKGSGAAGGSGGGSSGIKGSGKGGSGGGAAVAAARLHPWQEELAVSAAVGASAGRARAPAAAAGAAAAAAVAAAAVNQVDEPPHLLVALVGSDISRGLAILPKAKEWQRAKWRRSR
jgi:hypothetical protein